MSKDLRLQELAIVIVARNHNPSILNPDFLRYNDIVPRDWQVAKPPICTEPVSQVVFQSGVNIVAEFEKLSFSESFQAKPTEASAIAGIASKYLSTLPHVDYRAVGINPKGDVEVVEGEASKFVLQKLFRTGPWASYGGRAGSAAVKLTYPIEGGQLTLTVEVALKKVSQEQMKHVLLFGANFHHDLTATTPKGRVDQALVLIKNWRSECDSYLDFVNKSFLKEE